jgi:hypothetical protein
MADHNVDIGLACMTAVVIIFLILAIAVPLSVSYARHRAARDHAKWQRSRR